MRMSKWDIQSLYPVEIGGSRGMKLIDMMIFEVPKNKDNDRQMHREKERERKREWESYQYCEIDKQLSWKERKTKRIRENKQV